MISTVLAEHRWLEPTAFLVLLVAAPVAAWWLANRPRAARWLAAAAVAVAAGLTLWPDDRRAFSFCEVAWSVPTLFRGDVANVILFLAPVVLVATATRRPVLVAAVAIAVSAGVELLQAVAPALGRSCSTNDWLANSIGAVLGAALAWAGLRLARKTFAPTAR
ncbi:VanZ family protein [Blastococcus sp. KM273128]|uniref:VanZ family protein n=1 Tax=Blastococcus sp. KM273128 TaxID=2570314 RepID=UPI001F15B8AF|nr:VanZ family protein [Blastococcus sp. KM273128]